MSSRRKKRNATTKKGSVKNRPARQAPSAQPSAMAIALIRAGVNKSRDPADNVETIDSEINLPGAYVAKTPEQKAVPSARKVKRARENRPNNPVKVIRKKRSNLDLHHDGYEGVIGSKKNKVEPQSAIQVAMSIGDVASVPLAVFNEHSSIDLDLGTTGINDVYVAPKISGISLQPFENATRELDLVIGLDFGTSCLKVIIREQGGKRSWAIPFTDSAHMPYLLPAEVFLHESTFSLKPIGRKISGLKMPLLQNDPQAAHLISVIAFLALAIRHARGWMYQENGAFLNEADLVWKIQMGLPAANYEDSEKLSIFSRLLLAASNLAASSQSDITEDLVRSYLSGTDSSLENWKREGGKQWPYESLPIGPTNDEIDLFPELAAQVHGYVNSDQWDTDRPMFLLVDIGGGTVDASIIIVTKGEDDGIRYNFLRSKVEQLGSAYLHNKRFEWLDNSIRSQLKGDNLLSISLLRQLASFDEDQSARSIVPDSVREYAIKVEWPNEGIDEVFYKAFSNLLGEDVINTTRQNITNYWDGNWSKLNYLLCGGGSKNKFYQQFLTRRISSTSRQSVKLNEIRLLKPADLEAPSLSDEDYHRLSVAYGLAYRDIGEVITPESIEDYHLKGFGKSRPSWEDKFIDKDQM